MFNKEKPVTFKKGLYQHYKGNRYRVEDIVRHSETEQWMVLYRPCYGEAELWVRPYEMFYEVFQDSEGSVIERFKYIGE